MNHPYHRYYNFQTAYTDFDFCKGGGGRGVHPARVGYCSSESTMMNMDQNKYMDFHVMELIACMYPDPARVGDSQQLLIEYDYLPFQARKLYGYRQPSLEEH